MLELARFVPNTGVRPVPINTSGAAVSSVIHSAFGREVKIDRPRCRWPHAVADGSAAPALDEAARPGFGRVQSSADRSTLASPDWDVLVIGRSVTEATDPASALRELYDTLGHRGTHQPVGQGW